MFFLFALLSSCEPGGATSDRGEAEGEAGPLEVHQALENPLLHIGRKPAALPEGQISTYPIKAVPPHKQTSLHTDAYLLCAWHLTQQNIH